MLVTMALVKDDGQWFFYCRVGGSSRRTTIPSEFTIDSLDELIVEPVVDTAQRGQASLFTHADIKEDRGRDGHR